MTAQTAPTEALVNGQTVNTETGEVVESTIKTLKVEKVTPMKSTKDGSIIGYKHKLQSKLQNTQITPFGMATQGRQETYYMKLDAACQIGFTADIDLSKYRVVEEEFIVPDGEENAGTVMMLKNIYLKS